jgi:rubredoxin
MEKWKCALYDYVYCLAAGNPDRGIEPGTAFEDLPDGFAHGRARQKNHLEKHRWYDMKRNKKKRTLKTEAI